MCTIFLVSFWSLYREITGCINTHDAMYENEAMSVLSFDCGYIDLAILFISIILIILWKRSRRPVNYPPGPPTIPIIGNIHNIATVNFLQRIRDLRKKYGDVFSLSVGSYWVIVINGSTNLRELLVRRCEVTSDRPPLYMFNLAKNKGMLFYITLTIDTCSGQLYSVKINQSVFVLSQSSWSFLHNALLPTQSNYRHQSCQLA